MIEKLETPKSISWDNDVDSCLQRHKIITATIDKINELIDTINIHRIDLNNHTCRLVALENKDNQVTDEFEEQRKWIGKLCRFWDDRDEGCAYAILTGIDDTAKYPYQTKEGFSCGCCEPVSEDLIYKGE